MRRGCVAATGDIGDDGERLVIFAEAHAHSVELADRSRRAVRALTGLDPAEIVLLEPGTLPRTSSGKIRRRAFSAVTYEWACQITCL